MLIGSDLGIPLNRLLKKHVPSGRVFLFIDANVFALHGKRFISSIEITRNRRSEFVVPSGENAKSAAVLSGLHDFLLDHKVTRDDFILAVGGGVTSDLVGYAAATVLRGVRWGVIPTTLLSMADAAIGGKTGINHPRGKNLIGSFWQPSFVCSDVNFLMTLPKRHMVAGLGEIVKVAGLSGKGAFKVLEQYLDSDGPRNTPMLVNLIHTAAKYKVGIVSRDEREAGARLTLNFGHTFSHGIEHSLGHGRLLHGEAVILGIDAALALGEKLGFHSTGLEEYHSLVTELLSRLPRRKIDIDEVLEAMQLDKKRSVSGLRFVLLERIGRPVIRERVNKARVRASLEETLDRYRSGGTCND